MFVTNLEEFCSRLVNISDKKFCKNILGLGCYDKIASGNDFGEREILSEIFKMQELKYDD